MTQLAMRGYSLGLDIYSSIVNFFDSLSKAVIMARGVEANYKVAYELRHEYPDMSVPAIAAMLNERLRKEVYGD